MDILVASSAPSNGAFALSRDDRRTNTIGLIVSAFAAGRMMAADYAVAVLNGVVSAVADSDYNLTLFTRRWDNLDEPPPWLLDCHVDGLLLVAPNVHSDVVQFVMQKGIPLIGISAEAVDTGVPTVEVDNDGGAKLATEHLISLGHKRIAHLSGSEGQNSAYARRDAYYRTMKAHGLEIPDGYLVQTAYSGEKPYTEAVKMLRKPDRPTAIFAANDFIASEVLRAARDLGISVPRQLSVIGYDDIPDAVHLDPPLTTIRQPLIEMGQYAVSMLILQLNGQPAEVRTHYLPGELVVRGSTGPV